MSTKIKTVLGVIGLAILFGVVFSIASNHYNKYQTKVAAEKQQIAENLAIKAADLREASEAKQKRIMDQYTRTRMECEKGQAFYARLTAYQRSGLQAPNCGPAVID